MKTALILLSGVVLSAQGQGTFQNLDFEAATISQDQGLRVVNTIDALPEWTVYFGMNGPQTQIDFAGLIASPDGPLPWICLLGTSDFGVGSSIDGNFGVYLYGRGVQYPGEQDAPAASIRQTGLVPAGTESILFKAQPGNASLVLSLNGQHIPFFPLAIDPNYILYGGNVSSFAGQITELAFTAGIYGLGWNLDSIEFSDQPIPEPSTWTLFVVGAGLLFLHRRHRQVHLIM